LNGLELLASELSRYPFGHVSRSVGYLELIPKEAALGEHDLIRGCSFNMLGKPDSQWMCEVVDFDEWGLLPDKVKKFADEITKRIQEHYWKKGFFWGIAPKEKIIL